MGSTPKTERYGREYCLPSTSRWTLLTDTIRMAPIIYKPEAQDIGKQLWDETMAELSFAHLEEAIQAVLN